MIAQAIIRPPHTTLVNIGPHPEVSVEFPPEQLTVPPSAVQRFTEPGAPAVVGACDGAVVVPMTVPCLGCDVVGFIVVFAGAVVGGMKVSATKVPSGAVQLHTTTVYCNISLRQNSSEIQ
jgi:hypothetical protein